MFKDMFKNKRLIAALLPLFLIIVLGGVYALFQLTITSQEPLSPTATPTNLPIVSPEVHRTETPWEFNIPEGWEVKLNGLPLSRANLDTVLEGFQNVSHFSLVTNRDGENSIAMLLAEIAYEGGTCAVGEHYFRVDVSQWFHWASMDSFIGGGLCTSTTTSDWLASSIALSLLKGAITPTTFSITASTEEEVINLLGEYETVAQEAWEDGYFILLKKSSFEEGIGIEFHARSQQAYTSDGVQIGGQYFSWPTGGTAQERGQTLLDFMNSTDTDDDN